MSAEPQMIARDVAFVDTNALHNLALYASHAATHGAWPTPGESVCEAKPLIHRLHHGDPGLHDALVKALYLVSWCKAQPGIMLHYSVVSNLEMMLGTLRGRAVERAARLRLPGSWWTRLSAQALRDFLGPADYEATLGELGDLDGQFIVDEVRLLKASCDHLEDTVRMAEALLSTLLVEWPDALIMADAVCHQAAYIVTHDNDLRTLVNRIRTSAQHRRTQEALQEAYRSEAGDGTSSRVELVLPHAPEPKEFQKAHETLCEQEKASGNPAG